jgi:hypothetical protein
MEHKDAIETGAVERYLLEEMTEDERTVFEEHYFDCRVCAAGITEGTRLLVVGQRVAKEPSNVVPFRDRFGWIPATAAASVMFGFLGMAGGYQIAQKQHDPARELGRIVRIDTGISRAGAPAEGQTVQTGDVLVFDVEPRDDAASYAAAITCGEEVQSRKRISRERAADAVPLQLGELPAGRCELVIEGVRKDGKSFEITSSSFQVVGGREGVR